MYCNLSVVCLLIVFAYAGKLPAYIKPCTMDSADFNQCAIQHAKDALPYLLKGDRKFKIPPLNPLQLPEIVLSPSETFRIKLTDITVEGLQTANPRNVHFDLKNKKIAVDLDFDHLVITGQYDINGRIIIPLLGNGPANITVRGLRVSFYSDYDTIQKNNEDYVQLKNGKVTYNRDYVHYQFDNLFGNQEISDTSNRIINENVEEVGSEISGVLSETVRSIVNSILSNILTVVPLKELFA